jgi:hypothetical protein
MALKRSVFRIVFWTFVCAVLLFLARHILTGRGAPRMTIKWTTQLEHYPARDCRIISQDAFAIVYDTMPGFTYQTYSVQNGAKKKSAVEIDPAVTLLIGETSYNAKISPNGNFLLIYYGAPDEFTNMALIDLNANKLILHNNVSNPVRDSFWQIIPERCWNCLSSPIVTSCFGGV